MQLTAEELERKFYIENNPLHRAFLDFTFETEEFHYDIGYEEGKDVYYNRGYGEGYKDGHADGYAEYGEAEYRNKE